MDADAKEAAEAWFTILKAKDRYGRDNRVVETDEEALTDIIKRLVKKAGIETGNEQVRFHQLRVFLITRLSKVMEKNRWKQIVGKKVPEKAYVKPFQIRGDFKKVIPLIAISNQSLIGNEDLMKLQREVATLHARLRDRTDPLLNDIERLLQLPAGREFFSSLVKEAKEKLAEIAKIEKID